MIDTTLRRQAEAVLAAYRVAGLKLVVAESCTGGLITGTLTEIPGSSDVVERGYVTYSYEAKSQMLGVPADLIAEHGAVSEEVARAMALGALAHAHPYAQVSLAVTGVAGPGSDSQAKPAGLVHLASARQGKGALLEKRMFGDVGRDAVRQATVEAALVLLLRRLKEA